MECPICFENIEHMYKYKCLHITCNECFKKWKIKKLNEYKVQLHYINKFESQDEWKKFYQKLNEIKYCIIPCPYCNQKNSELNYFEKFINSLF